MTDGLKEQLTNVQEEYRRRRYKVFKDVAVLAVVPFALTAAGARFGVPTLVVRVGMLATMLGILVSVIDVIITLRCPACGASTYRYPPFRGKCLTCGVPLLVTKR